VRPAQNPRIITPFVRDTACEIQYGDERSERRDFKHAEITWDVAVQSIDMWT